MEDSVTSELATCADMCCKNPVFAKGWCKLCYHKKWNAARAVEVCTIEGCKSKRSRRTLCRVHYLRYLREKGTKWSQCDVGHCSERPVKPSRFCEKHDAVYGDGVSKHMRQNLTHEAIRRVALETQRMLDAGNFPIREQDRIPLD